MRLVNIISKPSSSLLISILSITCYICTHTSVAAFSIPITSCPPSIHHLDTSSIRSRTTLSESSSSSSSPSSNSPSDHSISDTTNDTVQSSDTNLKDRRSAISTAAGIITSGIVAPKINHALAADDSKQEQKKKQTSLYTIVDKIEKETYFGLDIQKLKNKEPLYKPNSNGAPEKHLPQITMNGNDIEIFVNHVMTEEHYIQFIWLREAESGDVVVVKACTPEEEKAFLKVRVPNGVTLTPCLYCNLHGLWKGEPFTVV